MLDGAFGQAVWNVTTLSGSFVGVIGTSNNGYANGAGTAASFSHPVDVATDAAGTILVVVR